MLPLKLVRSLVLGHTINHHPHIIHSHTDYYDSQQEQEQEQEEQEEDTRRTRRRQRRRRRRRSKAAGLLFLPTREIVTDTYRLAAIARALGMDLFPTPSLSHIIFSNPPPPSPSSSTPFSSSSTPSSSLPSTTTTTTTTTTTSSFSCSSSSWPLQNDAVPIPFPSLASAPLTHLRYFVNLAAPFFKLVFFDGGAIAGDGGGGGGGGGNWDCCSLSMYSRVTGERVENMEGFCRVLAGKGWTFFKTQKRGQPNAAADRGISGGGGSCEVYLFRKVDMNRVRVGRVGGGSGADGACRVRELRLPHLDFGNAPLRILQYILLMTDDIFCLA